jgi:hypothetical protein
VLAFKVKEKSRHLNQATKANIVSFAGLFTVNGELTIGRLEALGALRTKRGHSQTFAPIGDTRYRRAVGFALIEIPVRIPLTIGTLNHALTAHTSNSSPSPRCRISSKQSRRRCHLRIRASPRKRAAAPPCKTRGWVLCEKITPRLQFAFCSSFITIAAHDAQLSRGRALLSWKKLVGRFIETISAASRGR